MTEAGDFWARVEQGLSGCWFWMGPRSRDGYGKVSWHGRTMRAHRLAYQLHHGPIPATLQVCHSCDTPLCVKPEHLWLGTHRENHEDCTAKGRRPTGARHGSVTKPESRPRAATGTPMRTLADDFGLNLSYTYRIVRGEKWRSIQ